MFLLNILIFASIDCPFRALEEELAEKNRLLDMFKAMKTGVIASQNHSEQKQPSSDTNTSKKVIFLAPVSYLQSHLGFR